MKKIIISLMTAILAMGITAFAENAVDISTKFSDKDNWNIEADKTTVSGDTLKTSQMFISYGGQKFESESVTFSLKTEGYSWEQNDEVGESSQDWVGVCIRQRNNTDQAWAGVGRGYLVVIKPNNIELQRWYGGSNTGLFETVKNDFIHDNEKHNFEVKALNNDDGTVRYIMAIDGKIVWDFLDDDTDNAITTAGYIGFYNAKDGGSVELGKFDGQLVDIGESTPAVKDNGTDEPKDETKTDEPKNDTKTGETPSADPNAIVSVEPTKLIVNGQYIKTDVNPYLNGEVIMLPIRALTDAVGGTVTWNDEKQAADAVIKKTNISVIIGSKEYTGGGGPRVSLGAVALVNDRTMIPSDIIETQFLTEVVWDAETQTAKVDF